jgi:DNA-binding response OmpR family regulator
VRLLIVEDEVRLASALQRGLAVEGFTVDVAHTGPDGLHAAQETTYDAVILDIMLPGLSGYRIIEHLRAAENWVPILMLTAKDGEYDEADALDLGADDYLTKPFSFVVLLARIRALLRRGVTPRPASLAVDDLVLDPAAHTVRRGETTIDLTPREFSLLEFLMRRAGDADGLRRVAVNLIDNAVRYARSQVTVSLQRGTTDSEPTVTLQVTDDGRGIPPAERERVFDRFYRVQASRSRESGGTGLGLSIVRDLVRAHGGTVRLTARPDGPGVQAVVVLPARPA